MLDQNEVARYFYEAADKPKNNNDHDAKNDKQAEEDICQAKTDFITNEMIAESTEDYPEEHDPASNQARPSTVSNDTPSGCTKKPTQKPRKKITRARNLATTEIRPKLTFDRLSTEQFSRNYPYHTEILKMSLNTMLDTTLMMDFVNSLRQQFLAKNQLLLNFFDFDKIYRISKKSYSGVRAGHELEFAKTFLDDLSQGKRKEPQCIKGIQGSS